MIILPMMSISYDWAALEEAIRMAPTIPVALFSSRPRFLEIESHTFYKPHSNLDNTYWLMIQTAAKK